MSEFPDLRPDTLPLREALRGLRDALHRGGDAFLTGLPVDTLPGPTQRIARQAIGDLALSAQQVERATGALLNRLIPDDTPPVRTLDELLALPNGEGFGRAIYRALKQVAEAFGGGAPGLRETAARAAHARLPADLGTLPRAEAAARVALALRAAGVVQPLPGPAGDGAVPTAPVLLALMLWLLSDRPMAGEAEDAEALTAACDLARNLAPEAERAFGAPDAGPLAALIAEFSDHV